MQGQNLLAANGIEHPVRQLDLNPEQTAIEPVFAADGRGIDQSEAVQLLLVAGADIRRDTGAGKAIHRLAQRVIVFSGRSAIGENQQIIARNAHTLAHRLIPLQLFHQLRNAVNQDVLVVDGREALDARDDLQPVAVMLISANRGFRFLRKGVKGMLHLRNQILEHRIGYIADEQIAFIVPAGRRCSSGFGVLGTIHASSGF